MSSNSLLLYPHMSCRCKQTISASLIFMSTKGNMMFLQNRSNVLAKILQFDHYVKKCVLHKKSQFFLLTKSYLICQFDKGTKTNSFFAAICFSSSPGSSKPVLSSETYVQLFMTNLFFATYSGFLEAEQKWSKLSLRTEKRFSRMS